jgi:ferredoxin
MNEVTNNIRAAAKKLLEENKVDCVIGYKQGTVPLNDQPFFAYTPEEAEKLVWSNFCVSNLANFMIRRPGRIGVVAQGCVSRNIVGLLQEEQLKREDIHVIGVPCNGMLERRKIQALFPDKEILEIEEGDNDDIIVKGKDFEERVLRRDVKRDNCLTCQHRNPVVHDELAREKGDDSSGGDIDRMAAPWEKLSTEERQQKFKEAFKDCIRCYACRDVCPLCYCHVCFVDESNPQWCGKTEDEADVETFHILRAFHCAGRCTDCGACESACPVDIKMRLLTSKIEKDIREMYDYEPGMDPEATPPLSVYRPNDPEDFIK